MNDINSYGMVVKSVSDDRTFAIIKTQNSLFGVSFEYDGGVLVKHIFVSVCDDVYIHITNASEHLLKAFQKTLEGFLK